MESVINQDKMKNHTISRYKFKVLAMGGHDEHDEALDDTVTADEYQDEDSADTIAVQESEPKPSQDELVESLLKKTEDVTSNFIKMQMKYEAREESFKEELDAAKKESYEEGIKAGRSQAKEELHAARKDDFNQFTTSVKTLEESAEKFENALGSIQDELLQAALDIAKEVIDVEVTEHSNIIAKKLASQLIAELQGASKITLRVNPADHGYIVEKVGLLNHVEVISDHAVQQGGVIALSDVGNIDSEVMKRYARVKRAALSG